MPFLWNSFGSLLRSIFVVNLASFPWPLINVYIKVIPKPHPLPERGGLYLTVADSRLVKITEMSDAILERCIMDSVYRDYCQERFDTPEDHVYLWLACRQIVFNPPLHKREGVSTFLCQLHEYWTSGISSKMPHFKRQIVLPDRRGDGIPLDYPCR